MNQTNFPYKSVFQYLHQHGLLDASPEIISQAKKQYWKLYQQAYQKQYRQHRKAINLSIEPETYLELQDHSEILGLTVKELVEIAIEQYTRKSSRVAGIYRRVLRSLNSIQSEIGSFLRNRANKTPSKLGQISVLKDRVAELENVIRRNFE